MQVAFTLQRETKSFQDVIQGELLRDRKLQVSAVEIWHTGAHPQYFTAGGADLEATNNLLLILKIVL